jgi:CheY-like chemotaxis protein
VVMADDLQLQQALLNLTTNAAHAMRKMPSGELTVRLAPLGLLSPARRKHPILRSGNWAHLEISDTGEGMDEDTARRAFEPFFSTHAAREVGGGAGLGLSVVHGVVNGHGGVIDLTSTPGQGTRFDVYLPLQQQVARVSSDEAPATDGETKARILLVDDEPAVASVCRELLKMLGYEVDVSTDPREALERFAATPDRFDLVVTDHSMPHLTGLQLAEALAPMREARVPIVLTTGFAQDDVLSGTSRALIAEVVPKPYAIEELESAIVRALSARAN